LAKGNKQTDVKNCALGYLNTKLCFNSRRALRDELVSFALFDPIVARYDEKRAIQVAQENMNTK
jgi:hypothetical protein